MNHQFLLALLCEEIPANALPSARRQLEEGFAKRLEEAGFSGCIVRAYSTVRRLVVHVQGLPAGQPDRTEEITGPPARAAFTPDGSPTAAAVGFARGQGVSVDELRIVKGPKGDMVAVTRLVQGRTAPEILAEITAEVVGSLHFPKTMRWGSGEHTFVRPLHNLLALFGAETMETVVPLELLGLTSRGSTAGHRVVAPGRIEMRGITGFADYAARLEAAGVVVDHEVRRARLLARAEELAAEVGCTVRPDPALLDELVELVEHPGLVRGKIASRFLELPEEVLVTTLRHHQKSLVLEKNGRVAGYFLAVADRPDDPQGHVARGCSWVAGARLADASFFYAQDRKDSLASRVPALAGVTFHRNWGSYLDKTGKVRHLAGQLARSAELDVDLAHLDRAAELAKADLVTAMVGEFAELQGVMGGIYALADNEPEDVWMAIADQYRPAGLEGPVPRTLTGALLGVADRLDTLAALYASEKPSGSKDPFALRRAALAVVKICAEFPLPVDLVRACRDAAANRAAAGGDAIEEFVQDRLRHYLTSVVGVRPDVADAVLAAHWGVVPDDVARARALEAVRQDEVFDALAIAFKRVRNILTKGAPGTLDESLLTVPAERELLSAVATAEARVGESLGEADHEAALHALAALAAPLDRFFTDVMVLCEDPALRQARLGLLARIERLFLRLADVSRLAAEAR
ncbi:MAG TPA: glycine--tRNA ligase subunit beta [Thermoanaerobaculaceae bacterium]|nr:glycine--tRNA ligase subunit beta [Thermoanaerobaculaceae bacterium]HRS16518.1 glycine--tRNA ligase subunit beta [Thermoanaerobaculaceae bacterium]